ncbi:hypothetical protein [Roseicella aquatilis]|uniref:Uncharacterized protein n=1 Tax=Roseicella aquatilis TaxID=2527868 RepID=A0A4R4DKJ3_9PROT|nr:hypothetical protein [Roseicella aquatilis]TCZ61149.1 hypothetical protein EXY23_13550 [Roseicella aquatilis]
MTRLFRRVELRTGPVLAIAGLLLLGGGYALGRWEAGGARGEAPGGAGFLAGVAELNDLAGLRRHCERNAYDHAGRRACVLPPVWISGTR